MARKIISLGIKLHGEFEQDTKSNKTHFVPPPAIKHDAVVETTNEQQHWSPEQTGNVVIAEPLMVTKFRNQKHDM